MALVRIATINQYLAKERKKEKQRNRKRQTEEVEVSIYNQYRALLTHVTNSILTWPCRFFSGFNCDNRIRGPELSRKREEEEHTTVFPARREEVTQFFRLFERSNCVLLLLMSTGSTIEEEEVKSGGKENEKTGRDSSMLRGRLNCTRSASRQ